MNGYRNHDEKEKTRKEEKTRTKRKDAKSEKIRDPENSNSRRPALYRKIEERSTNEHATSLLRLGNSFFKFC